MASPASKPSLEERLKLVAYNAETKLDAIYGKKVPLELGAAQMQACLIRGIRHHDKFGTELRGIPMFDRALHARDIMSNRIPEIDGDDKIPYCIWYPDVASEETYRQLAQKYPKMRYHVGRACAVAGYVDLYRELNLLPEVAIAEEARDNEKNGTSIEIFNDIMAAPTRFAVMNDYTRTINTDTPISGACLNADTAVRSSLNWRREYPYGDSYNEEYNGGILNYIETDADLYEPGLGVHDSYWNITEDWKFDEEKSEDSTPSLDLRIPLLYSPLPRDLPNINKDVLICQAAHAGDIDRYVRLRRNIVELEFFEHQCVLRGIHFNTMFAKWWSLQPEILDHGDRPNFPPHPTLNRAINARFIMNNNLTRMVGDVPEDYIPYFIYWPNIASENALKELFRLKPCMKLQIARSCIIGDYQELYEELDVEPDEYLAWEAAESPNTFYALDQKTKADAQGYEGDDDEDWKQHTIADLRRGETLSSWAFELEESPQSLGRDPFPWGQGGLWEGCEEDMRDIEDAVGRTIQPLYKG